MIKKGVSIQCRKLYILCVLPVNLRKVLFKLCYWLCSKNQQQGFLLELEPTKNHSTSYQSPTKTRTTSYQRPTKTCSISYQSQTKYTATSSQSPKNSIFKQHFIIFIICLRYDWNKQGQGNQGQTPGGKFEELT